MRHVLLIALLLALLGCGQKRAEFEFCHADKGTADRQAVRIHVAGQRVLSDDASFPFTLVESDRVKGFLTPFPLVLPKAPANLQDLPQQWVLSGYEITLQRALGGNADALVVRSRPLAPGIATGTTRSTVLYSASQGVQTIQLSHGDANMDTQLLSCGTGQLHASSF